MFEKNAEMNWANGACYVALEDDENVCVHSKGVKPQSRRGRVPTAYYLIVGICILLSCRLLLETRLARSPPTASLAAVPNPRSSQHGTDGHDYVGESGNSRVPNVAPVLAHDKVDNAMPRSTTGDRAPAAFPALDGQDEEVIDEVTERNEIDKQLATWIRHLERAKRINQKRESVGATVSLKEDGISAPSEGRGWKVPTGTSDELTSDNIPKNKTPAA